MPHFVQPNSNPTSLLDQFFQKFFLTLTFSFLSGCLTPIWLVLCWLQCQQRWNDICCHNLSHSHLLWESDLLCTMMSEANINFASSWSQYFRWSGHGNVAQISCDIYDIYVFWMHHQVCNCLYYDSHKWQNYNSGMFRPSKVFIFEITVLRCTCFQVSLACCNSSSVIVTTKWSKTWVPICTGTSPHICDLE